MLYSPSPSPLLLLLLLPLVPSPPVTPVGTDPLLPSPPLTFERPLIFLMQKVSSSLDSGSALTQCLGGCRYRPQSLHHSTVT